MRAVDLQPGGRYLARTELNEEHVVYLDRSEAGGSSAPRGQALVRNRRGREYYVAYASLHPAEDVPEYVQPPQRPEGIPSHDHPTGQWRLHSGWAAPVWHDGVDPTPVHLYDLTHSRVPQPVRDRALLALRKLVDPTDTATGRLRDVVS